MSTYFKFQLKKKSGLIYGSNGCHLDPFTCKYNFFRHRKYFQSIMHPVFYEAYLSRLFQFIYLFIRRRVICFFFPDEDLVQRPCNEDALPRKSAGPLSKIMT